MLTLSALALVQLWTGSALALPCESQHSSKDLSLALATAEARFGVRDKAGVLESAAEASTIVPCLNEEVTTITAARFHRVQGFSAFLEKQPDRARLWFAASRTVQPAYALPSSLVPEGHPLHQLYSTAAAPVDVERIDAPAEGELRFDGQTSLDRPLKRPSLYQYINGIGQVEISQVLEPGSQIQLPTVAVVAADPLPAAQNTGLRTGLLAGSGASLLTSGVLYFAALNAKAKYEDTAIVAGNRSQLQDLYQSNRTLATTSGIFAGTALSLGVGALLVDRK